MKVVIIGAGTMGMTVGYRLSQAGLNVQIVEAQSQVGGLSTWFNYGDFVWDKYYHVILRSDEHLLNLIQELQLSNRLTWTPTKTGFLWRGNLLSLSNHWEFLRFPALSLPSKVRLGLGILYSHYIQNPEQLERIPAAEWLVQVFGRPVYETMWEPLLESKFGVLKNEVPARILWSYISRYFSTRSKGAGKEYMGHLHGSGLKSLFDALDAKIKQKQGEVRCNIIIKSMDEERLVATSGEAFPYDRVISTLPLSLLFKIAPFTRELFSLPVRPKFLGVIRLALVLKRPLSPYYVTNLIDKGLPFTGIIEVSALTEPQELSGENLVMIPRYDVPDSPWFHKSDDEIFHAFLTPLLATWPDLQENIIRSYVHRESVVQALWIDKPQNENLVPVSPDRKIWSINAELAGRDTLNNNAIVRIANQMSRAFLDDLRC